MNRSIPEYQLAAFRAEAAELLTRTARQAGAYARQQGRPRQIPEGAPTRGGQAEAFLFGWDTEDERLHRACAPTGVEA